MSNLIKDGKGRGYLAEVTKEQRLRTSSTQLSNLYTISIEKELAFAVPSNFVPLTTTGSFSGVLYVQNTSNQDLHISTIALSSTVNTQWQYITLPTGGTITGGAASDAYNINLGSKRQSSVNARIGFDGATVIGGVVQGNFVTIGTGQFKVDGAALVPTNGAIAFSAKPSAAADVSLDLYIYFDIAS